MNSCPDRASTSWSDRPCWRRITRSRSPICTAVAALRIADPTFEFTRRSPSTATQASAQQVADTECTKSDHPVSRWVVGGAARAWTPAPASAAAHGQRRGLGPQHVGARRRGGAGRRGSASSSAAKPPSGPTPGSSRPGRGRASSAGRAPSRSATTRPGPAGQVDEPAGTASTAGSRARRHCSAASRATRRSALEGGRGSRAVPPHHRPGGRAPTRWRRRPSSVAWRTTASGRSPFVGRAGQDSGGVSCGSTQRGGRRRASASRPPVGVGDHVAAPARRRRRRR